MRRDHCHGLIEHTLGHQPFTLNNRAPIRQLELDGTVLLGLYSAPGKPAAAVGVFDAGALCLLGGGALRLTPVRIASALANGGPTADMIAQATTLMRAAGMMLQGGDSEEGCSLARTMSVQPDFKKLEEVLARPEGRCDFQLLVPDIGAGLMSFIAL
ncbi:MAG: hypothetical protein HY021_10940 [Burkholderiales bacterium]|nr:hypothetical protein [Burkholderiales bacterium]